MTCAKKCKLFSLANYKPPVQNDFKLTGLFITILNRYSNWYDNFLWHILNMTVELFYLNFIINKSTCYSCKI